MRRLLKAFFYLIAALLLLSIALLQLVDPRLPQEKEFYPTMQKRLDSVKNSIQLTPREPFKVGFAKVSLTPDSAMALAGYGARKPKLLDGVLDSVFARCIVVKSSTKKIAILSADLLIIHPEVTYLLHKKLVDIGWRQEDVFLTATHSHSSIGQWAPGIVGGLFAGEYSEDVSVIISNRLIQSIIEADKVKLAASFGFSESSIPDLVRNRLVGEEGEEDPFLKTLQFRTSLGKILFSAYSAHATCLGRTSRKLSGDFPSYFHQEISADTAALFSSYAAGAVASMGPETPDLEQEERAKYLGGQLAEGITPPRSFDDSIRMASHRFTVEIGEPQFKISQNIVLRPYLFDIAFGKEPVEVSVAGLGNTLLIGMPCDFSGELALPLYDLAEQQGLNLVITSFNGGYMGYITKDDWYDLDKYETRTMSWYGPGQGAYFSEIAEQLIIAYAQALAK